MSPWIESVVMQTLRELCGPMNKPISAGKLGDFLEQPRARRTAYGYLRELEQAGMVVRPSPRRWCVA